MKYALTHCTIIDGYLDHEVLENQTIYIDGEKIVAITSSEEKAFAEYKEYDMTGKYVMPGLINMHVHLFGSGKPSKALGGGKSQKTILKLVQTKLGNKVLDQMVKSHLKQQLLSGVTTIRTVGDFYDSDIRARNKIRQGKMKGPRLFVSGPAITTSIGHGAGTFAKFSDTIEGLEALVEENYAKGVDFIKTCTTGGVMDAKKLGEPGEVKMTLEQTKAICDKAHSLGMKVASHVESELGVDIALKGGVDTIEHGSHLSEEALQIFKTENKAFISTLSPAVPLAKLDYQTTMLTEFGQYNAKVVYDNMIVCAKQVMESGITMGMGTDASCPFVSQYNTWRELKYTMDCIGTSSSFAIYTATLSNAKILGIDSYTGSVESGKIADLLILKENPLQNIETLGAIDAVICRGDVTFNPKPKHVSKIDAVIAKLS